MPKSNKSTEIGHMPIPVKPVTGFLGPLQRWLVAGVLVLIPVAVTICVLKWLFDTIDGIAQPVLMRVFHQHIPGLGLVIALMVALAVGFTVSTLLGKRFLYILESVVLRIPLARTLYSVSKQAIDAFSGEKNATGKRIILVEFPRRGMLHIGFVTSTLTDQDGKQWVTVYLPTVPNFLSGFMVIVPEEETSATSFTLDDIICMMTSGGASGPVSGAFVVPKMPAPELFTMASPLK